MKMSRIESGVRMVLAYNDAFNRHNVAGMAALLSDDCHFDHTSPAPDGEAHTGKEAIAQFWQEFFRQLPQAHRELEDIFGLGMRCVARWRQEWVDAAGEKRYVRGVDIYQMRDGRIHEIRSYLKG